MRYILRRDSFLEKEKINEVFKNELTWGGSLFGRLINSAIRKMKINYDSLRMNETLVEIENTIYEILRESMDKDLRVKLYRLRIKNYVAQIKDVSLSAERALPDWDEDIDCGGAIGDTKLVRLIGQEPSDADITTTPDITDKWKDLPVGSLIGDLLSEIETLTELKKLFKREELDDLRDIHSDFAIELRRFRWEKCNPTEQLGGDNARRNQWKNRTVVSDSDEVLRREISVKNESINRKIFKKFSDFENYRSYFQEISEDTSSSAYSRSSIGFKPSASTTTTTTTSTTTTPTTPTTTLSGTSSTTTTTTTTTSPTPSKKKSDEDSVSDIWRSFFPKAGINESSFYQFSSINEKNLSAFRLTRDDEKELEDLENQLAAGTFTLDYEIASDAMIRLFNLLTVAYRLFATDYIPSGRPGGRVSMKTFREYEKLGSGGSKATDATSSYKDAGGEAVIPLFGPWAKKIVYRKFQNFVNRLLQDQKLRKIFANINFEYPGTEDKFNDSYRWKILLEANETPEQKITTRGKMGPILFNLLQDLATPSKCRGEDLIDEATRKYFGQEIQEKLPDLTHSADKSKNSDTDDNCLSWMQKQTLSTAKNNLWCIPTSGYGLSDTEKNDLEYDHVAVLENKTGTNVPIYIQFLDTDRVEKIETTSTTGTTIKFYPVKITFKTPLEANKYYEDKKDTENYTGYTDYSFVAAPDPNIYYGYLYSKSAAGNGDKVWIFYVDHSVSPIGGIHYQRVKISPQDFSNLKDPDSAGAEGDARLQLSGLWDKNNKHIKFEPTRLKGTDRERYEDFFNFPVNTVPFKEFFKSILDNTVTTNQNRITVIAQD